MIYVFNSLFEIITFLIIVASIVLIINYIFINDFRKLINKIKRVIFNPRKVNKITQIKKLVYEYLFID
nr:MAG TPA: hypothetical protein [Caudoviricetes sp.]